MADLSPEKIFATLVVLIVMGLIGIHIAGASGIAGIKINLILFVIMVGIVIFSAFILLRQASEARAGLNLNSIVLPLLAIAGIVVLFVYFPQLVPKSFSAVKDSLMSIQGQPGQIFSVLGGS